MLVNATELEIKRLLWQHHRQTLVYGFYTHTHIHTLQPSVLDKDTNKYKQTALTPRQTVRGGMEFSSNTQWTNTARVMVEKKTKWPWTKAMYGRAIMHILSFSFCINDANTNILKPCKSEWWFDLHVLSLALETGGDTRETADADWEWGAAWPSERYATCPLTHWGPAQRQEKIKKTQIKEGEKTHVNTERKQLKTLYISPKKHHIHK